MSLLSRLRFDLRAAGFVGLTLSMYGMLEADTVLGPGHEAEQTTQRWVNRYGRAMLGLFGVQVEQRGPFLGEGRAYPGVDARGLGRVFIMNHRSSMDILVALAAFEATLVSRADLARWPVIGLAARRVGTLFVDRTSKQSGAAVLQAMADALQRGQGVMLFPEGTTYSGDEVRPFQVGAFSAAARVGAEIVPAGLAYESDAATFGDESFGEHINRVAGAPHTRAALVVGEPLPPSDDRDALRTRAHARVEELVAEARKVFTP
jgi:1-acyl-sn-glycerol-3-phosphate acyltransferase